MKQTGIGFFGLLTIVFIVLKLTGVIHWSWFFVMLPLFLPAAIFIAVMVLLYVFCLLSDISYKIRKKFK